jgi:hypothetical protein
MPVTYIVTDYFVKSINRLNFEVIIQANYRKICEIGNPERIKYR